MDLGTLISGAGGLIVGGIGTLIMIVWGWVLAAMLAGGPVGESGGLHLTGGLYLLRVHIQRPAQA